jgi:hypothetical protein
MYSHYCKCALNMKRLIVSMFSRVRDWLLLMCPWLSVIEDYCQHMRSLIVINKTLALLHADISVIILDL